MSLLTEQNSITHEVVRVNLENKQDTLHMHYGTKGECNKWATDVPKMEGYDFIVVEIDQTDPRHAG